MNHDIDVTRRRIGRNQSTIEQSLTTRFAVRENLDNILVWLVTFLFAMSTFHLMFQLRQSTLIGGIMAFLGVAATEGVFLSYLHYGFPLAENTAQRNISLLGLLISGLGSFVFAIADLSFWLGYDLSRSYTVGSISVGLETIVITTFIVVSALAIVLKSAYRLSSSHARHERKKSTMQLGILEKQYRAELDQATADFDILQAQTEQKILATLEQANAIRTAGFLPEQLARYAQDVLGMNVLPEAEVKVIKPAKQEKVLYERECAYCHQTFESEHPATKYCPETNCRALASAERRRSSK